MKQTISVILLFLISFNRLHAQDIKVCEQIVQKTYEAVQTKNLELIKPHLAEDFSTAGYSGDIAIQVLSQILNQLNSKITNIQPVSTENNPNLTLTYEADFSDIGAQTSTFVFNKDNKIKELTLIGGIRVKRKSGATEIKKNPNKSFSVPFEYAGKLIVVKATLNGVEGNYLIDNGAPVLILNAKHYNTKEENTKVLGSSSAQGVGGSTSNLDLFHVENFNFNGIEIDNQDLLTLDIAHLEEELKIKIDGLIGYEVYKDYDLVFDYANKTLTFVQPEYATEYLNKNYSNKKRYETTITMENHIPVVQATINKETYNLGIDCGAEGNLFDIKHSAKILPQLKSVKNTDLMGANKNVLQVKSGKLKSMKIANLEFKNLQSQLNSMDDLNNGYNMKLDGLIGYENLSKQVTLLSFVNKKLIFIK